MENNTNDVWMVRVFDFVVIKIIENNINTHGKHEYFYGFYGFGVMDIKTYGCAAWYVLDRKVLGDLKATV